MEMRLLPDERLDVVSDRIKLIQKKKGFCYGTDAVLLASYVKPSRGTAVELGAGSGIVSFLCEAHKKAERIYAIELNDSAYDMLRRSVELNSSSVIPQKRDVRELGPAEFGGECAAVFSNPPYMKSDSGFLNGDEIKRGARHEMAGDINDFCAAAGRLLSTGGSFYCVYRPDRLTELFCAMHGSFLEPKRITFVHPFADKRSNLVLVEAKKDAAAGLFVTKPLVTMEKDPDGKPVFTEEYNEICEKCGFDERYLRI